MKTYQREMIEEVVGYIKACITLGFDYTVKKLEKGNSIEVLPKSYTKQSAFLPSEEIDALRKLDIPFELSFKPSDSMHDPTAFTLTY